MKQFIALIAAFVLIGCHRPPVFLQAGEVQLSRPDVSVKQVFFTDSTHVHIGPQPAGTQLHYSLDGSANLNSAKAPLILKETMALEVSSKGPDYQPSDSLRLEVFKVKAINGITIRHSGASAPYDGAPAKVLVDHRKAGKDFHAGGWLGFQDSIVTLEIDLPEETHISGLVLSCLEDQPSWIFAPQRLIILYYDEHDYEIFQQEVFYAANNQLTESRFYYFKVAMETIKPRRIKLEVHSLPGIPEWHPGKGNPPWLFIDEIALL